ncbi:hypothetical protein QPK87_37375 [Kamptonema cortianum]|nr:hypothetical protein [Geitlerinema splendidum]MDK3162180.1 hypothetical protein [Kamptonema cortianum]
MVSSFALSLALSSTFVFKGGNEHELAAALSDHLKVPVVIQSETLISIDSIDTTYTQFEGLRRSILTASGLQSHLEMDEKGTEKTDDDSKKWLAVYREFYDSSFRTLNGQMTRYSDSHDPFILKLVEDGPMNFSVPSGKYYSFRSDEAFAKGEMAVFPLYVKPFLIGHGSFKNRVEFLEAASKALGARVVRREGQLSIDLDYASFRERIRARPDNFPALNVKPEEAAYEVATRRFVKECYLSLSESQVREGYVTPGKLFYIDISENSTLHKMTSSRVQALMATSLPASAHKYLDNVDRSGAYRFIFSGAGGCSTVLKGLNGHIDFGF